MYQGKNPTALHSQKLLLDALRALLQQKEFKDISVSELCCQSGVSRQTFYTLFGTKENMLRHQLEQATQAQQVSREVAAKMTLHEMCQRYSAFVIANYLQLKMLVDNDLVELLNGQFYQAMSSCRESYVELDDEERDYAALFMSAGLSRLTQRYIQHHEIPDCGELTRLSYKIMSGSIYRI